MSARYGADVKRLHCGRAAEAAVLAALLGQRGFTGTPDVLERDPWGWSAVTQEVDGCAVVIYNPRHSSGRRAVDIMHELAHLLLDHEPGTVILSHDGSIVMRTYNAKQEEEASWLAGCLLLPRVALLKVTRGGMSPAQIADHFGVSEPLATFRIRICGVEAQLRAMAGRSRRSRSAGRS